MRRREEQRRPSKAELGPYRKVYVRAWSDENVRALGSPKPSAHSLWFYLLTGPRTSPVPGLVPSTIHTIAGDLGWSVVATRRAWKAIADRGMARADWDAGLVWLPRAVVYNEPESPNVVRSWRRSVAVVPECDLLRQAIATLRAHTEAMGEAFRDAFAEAFPEAFPEGLPKALRQPSPNQEQEQEQEYPPTPQGGAGESAAQLPEGTRERRRQRRGRGDGKAGQDGAAALAGEMVLRINGGRPLCLDVATGLLAKGVPPDVIRTALQDASPEMTPNAFQAWVLQERFGSAVTDSPPERRCAGCGLVSSGPSGIALRKVAGQLLCGTCEAQATPEPDPCTGCGSRYPADEKFANRMAASSPGTREVRHCETCGGYSVVPVGGAA